MISGRIEGATRHMAIEQDEYTNLWIKDAIIIEGDQSIPIMSCVFFPDPGEIEDIVAGAPVILTIMGTKWPPVALMTGNKPEEEPNGT